MHRLSWSNVLQPAHAADPTDYGTTARRVLLLAILVVLAGVGTGAFSPGIHADITRQALVIFPEQSLRAFISALPQGLRGEAQKGFSFSALQEIIDANEAMDTGDCRLGSRPEMPASPCDAPLAALFRLLRGQAPAREHFDAEKIQDGSNRIFESRGRIRDYLQRRQFVAARKELGGALHSIQDFYAHTNWVELGYLTPDRRLGAAQNAFNDVDVGKPRIARDTEPTCVDGSILLTDLDAEGRQAYRKQYGVEPLGTDRPLTSGYFFVWGDPRAPDGLLTLENFVNFLRAGIIRDPAEVTARQKCRHGYSPGNVVTQPGINKDDFWPDYIRTVSRRRGYDTARALATGHSVDFVVELFNDPELRKDTNTYFELMLGLMGHEIVAAGRGTLVAAGLRKQTYDKPIAIDLSGYERGMLVIEVQLDAGESLASFNLYPEGFALPTEGDPVGQVSHAWDVRPGTSVSLRYQFSQPARYTLGASGNWFSRAGSTNTYSYYAYVENGTQRASAPPRP